MFGEIAFRVPGQLWLKQFIGIVLFVAGLCVMADHLVGGIHEMRESFTWSTLPVSPAVAGTESGRPDVRRA